MKLPVKKLINSGMVAKKFTKLNPHIMMKS